MATAEFPVTDEPVEFTEAYAYLRNKLTIPTETWRDIWQKEHAKAFVIAGAMQDDVLSDMQKALLKAIRNGTTLEDFRNDFDQIVKKTGWSYNGSRGWRTKIIFETNMRQSHMAGRWEQVQRNKESYPYLRYVALRGGNRRPEHQKLHGLVRPVDDPIWDKIYPMNGWNCKCTVRPVSEAEMERRDWAVTPDEAIPKLDQSVIDPAFDYNVGKAAFGKAQSEKLTQEYNEFKKNAQKTGEKIWKPFDERTYKDKDWRRPDKIPLDLPPAALGSLEKTKAGFLGQAKRILGGDNKIFRDPSGRAVNVVADSLIGHFEDLKRSPFIPWLPSMIENPYEIWSSFEENAVTGQVALRRRYIKMIDDEGKDKPMIFVANVIKGTFESWTFFPAKEDYLQSQRYGKLEFGRKEK